MSHYRNRIGQRVGSLVVVEDYGRTKRRGTGGRAVIWRLVDTDTGRDVYLRTADLIRGDREHLARQAAAAEATNE